MKLDAAVVGLGRVGARYEEDPRVRGISTHARAYDRHPATRLVGGADPDRGARRAFERRFGRPAFESAEEMYDALRPAVVGVCTPPDSHAGEVARAARRGVRAVLCEKPFGDDVRRSRAAAAACARRNVVLGVNYWRRVEPAHRDLRDRLRRGILGVPRLVRGTYARGLRNEASHMLDFLRFCFGPSRVVEVRSGLPSPSFTLRYADGVTAEVAACDPRSYNLFELEILASRGRVRVRSDGYRFDWERPAPSPHVTGQATLRRIPPPVRPRLSRLIWWAVDDIVRALRAGRRPACPGEEAIETSRLIGEIERRVR